MNNNQSVCMLSVDEKGLTNDLDRAGYRKMGAFMKRAQNYEEAQGILKKSRVDVVVINLDYEAADGFAIIKHLKADEKYSTLPIVATSVQSSAQFKKKAIDAGCDLYIEQPLPRQYFVEKIRGLLELKTRDTNRMEAFGIVQAKISGESYECPIGDISTSGMLMSTERIFDLDQECELVIHLAGIKKPINVSGKVVRIISDKSGDQATGIGIQFVSFKASDAQRLEKFITKSADSRMVYYL